MPTRQDYLDTVFLTLEGFAARGQRCPANGTHGIDSKAAGPLARAGRIRVYIYAHNWRVVEIMTGPHAGARTAPPPNPHLKPWRVISTEDTHTHTHRQRTAQPSAQPSAPRPLTPDDLRKL